MPRGLDAADGGATPRAAVRGGSCPPGSWGHTVQTASGLMARVSCLLSYPFLRSALEGWSPQKRLPESLCNTHSANQWSHPQEDIKGPPHLSSRPAHHPTYSPCPSTLSPILCFPWLLPFFLTELLKYRRELLAKTCCNFSRIGWLGSTSAVPGKGNGLTKGFYRGNEPYTQGVWDV